MTQHERICAGAIQTLPDAPSTPLMDSAAHPLSHCLTRGLARRRGEIRSRIPLHHHRFRTTMSDQPLTTFLHGQGGTFLTEPMATPSRTNPSVTTHLLPGNSLPPRHQGTPVWHRSAPAVQVGNPHAPLLPRYGDASFWDGAAGAPSPFTATESAHGQSLLPEPCALGAQDDTRRSEAITPPLLPVHDPPQERAGV